MFLDDTIFERPLKWTLGWFLFFIFVGAVYMFILLLISNIVAVRICVFIPLCCWCFVRLLKQSYQDYIGTFFGKWQISLLELIVVQFSFGLGILIANIIIQNVLLVILILLPLYVGVVMGCLYATRKGVIKQIDKQIYILGLGLRIAGYISLGSFIAFSIQFSFRHALDTIILSTFHVGSDSISWFVKIWHFGLAYYLLGYILLLLSQIIGITAQKTVSADSPLNSTGSDEDHEVAGGSEETKSGERPEK